MDALVIDRTTQERQLLIAALSRVAQGDRDALREVYDRTSAKLYGLCLRILDDRSEAEDAMQDIYLNVWRRAGAFDPTRSSPVTWLAVIARSRAIDRLRASSKPRSTASIEAASEVRDPAPDALSELARAQENGQLNGCVEELEQRQGSAIRSAFFDGLTYSQLADRADVPLGTMKSWIRRGLIKLRECLER